MTKAKVTIRTGGDSGGAYPTELSGDELQFSFNSGWLVVLERAPEGGHREIFASPADRVVSLTMTYDDAPPPAPAAEEPTKVPTVLIGDAPPASPKVPAKK